MNKQSEAASLGYVIVTDYIQLDGVNDLSAALQQIIDDNPNRTLYFPDGVYPLSHPIATPADPRKSVDLRLSNYAILRATPDFTHKETMVRLGGKCPANDIATPGSLYSLTGGIVDGNGVATGISIESGRETRIAEVSIKNTVIGIHILRGANANSSDADILNVNIVGRGGNDSIGVWLEGFDNTLTNMRIANVNIGVKLSSSGNLLRNIHPLYYLGSSDYETSYGFYDESGNNWYDVCYSDQFRCGFYIDRDLSCHFDSCFCFWYSGKGDRQTAFRSGGRFQSLVSSIRAGFHPDSKENALLELGQAGGSGVIEYALTDAARLTNCDHEAHLKEKIIV